jgi:hypothetical protein
LAAAPRKSPITVPDVDVHRDQRGTRVAMAALALLGAVGLISAVVWLSRLPRGRDDALAGLAAVVALAVVFSAVWVYGGRKPPAGVQGVGRVFVNTLYVFGIVIAAPVLLALAIVIGFLTICL